MKKHFFSFWLLLAMSATVAVFNSCGDEPSNPTTDKGVEIDGIVWATRNLNTHGNFVNNPQDLGALFQWGRLADGHERRSSDVTMVLSTSDVPGHGFFIVAFEGLQDWRTPQNDALWNRGTIFSPVKTTGDPCPRGWRVPTQIELASLVNSGSTWTIFNGVSGRRFGTEPNTIFLPAAGWRSDVGTIVGSGGMYWSSSAHETVARSLWFAGNNVELGNSLRVNGFSIRCVAE